MARDTKAKRQRLLWPRWLLAAALLGAAASAGAVLPALAQGFTWPWEEDEPRRVPRERPRAPEPAYPDNPDLNYGNGMQRPPPTDGWQRQSSICLELEQRLVQETQFGGNARQRLPQLEAEIRDLNRVVHTAERDLERADCYEYFIFSKSLRRSSQCLALARKGDDARRRLAQLEGERQDIISRSSRSYQDEIIRELARNGCGDSYTQESRRRDRQFSPFWQDEEGSGGSGYANSYNALPFATYRTLCVRLCDGYYFPVSFSTLPNHFQRDAEICQAKCASPAALYYHQNPGAGVEQMVAYGSNEPYTKLKVAFRYRKEYVSGCSCKESEYIPQSPMPDGSGGQIDGAAPQQGAFDRRAEGPSPGAPAR